MEVSHTEAANANSITNEQSGDVSELMETHGIKGTGMPGATRLAMDPRPADTACRIGAVVTSYSGWGAP
jgi:hypothetical protein